MSDEARDAYNRLLARVEELEVDLGRTSFALKQAMEDNEQLRVLHDDIQDLYSRNRSQLDTARQELNEERDARASADREFQEQIQLWHQDLENKARELEELQGQQPQRELDLLRLRVVEEFEEPYEQKLKALNLKMQAESRKAGDAKRMLEMEKLERKEEVRELQEVLEETKEHMKTQTEALMKQLGAHQEENKKLQELSASSHVLRTQLQEYQTKCKFFQSEMDELMVGHKAEVDELSNQILALSKESQKIKKEKRHEEVEKEKFRRELEEQNRQLSLEREQREKLTTEVSSLRLRIQEISTLPAPILNSDRISELQNKINDLDKQLAVKTQEVTMLQERERKRQETWKTETVAPQGLPGRDTKSTDLPLSRDSQAIGGVGGALRGSCQSGGSAALTLTASRLREEADRLRASVHEKEESIRRVAEEWQKEVELAREENAKLITEHKKLKEARQVQEEELSQTREAMKTARTSTAELEQTVEELRRKHKGADEALREKDEEKASFIAKAASLKHEVELCQTRLEEMEKHKQETNQRYQMAQSNLDEQKKAHSKESKEHVAKINALKKLNKELRTKTLTLVQRMNQLQEEKQSLMTVCEENRHKYELYMAEARSSLQFNANVRNTDLSHPIQAAQ